MQNGTGSWEQHTRRETGTRVHVCEELTWQEEVEGKGN